MPGVTRMALPATRKIVPAERSLTVVACGAAPRTGRGVVHRAAPVPSPASRVRCRSVPHDTPSTTDRTLRACRVQTPPSRPTKMRSGRGSHRSDGIRRRTRCPDRPIALAPCGSGSMWRERRCRPESTERRHFFPERGRSRSRRAIAPAPPRGRNG